MTEASLKDWIVNWSQVYCAERDIPLTKPSKQLHAAVELDTDWDDKTKLLAHELIAEW